MADLITCKHCGVVERGHCCPYRPKPKPKESNEVRRFRNTQAWIEKSNEIKQKARYLCEVCNFLPCSCANDCCRKRQQGVRRLYFHINQKGDDLRSSPFWLVRETGLEPVRCEPHAPQTCASASSATLAR